MSELPTGTVTFLFTDIEGSTRLIEELGERGYVEALAEHRHALRAAFAAHGGVEVDSQGDAFFYAFADPGEALAAAEEAQKALASGLVMVRMGLHTGEPLLTGDGYAGRELHRAARIAAAGHGGQVLVSGAAAALVDDCGLTELGEHRFKDFPEPIPLFQLGDEKFPPLRTISNTNLPRPASSFVGRERELADVTKLLQDGARLVTLSGPGGSGKTRLAIEAASELVPEFKAGVFWVPLAALRDSALVTETIGQALGAKDVLAEHIGERELLLLLDNLEQVIEAAPQLATLLQWCPNLKLLVTSRELLRVRGEVEYAVSPLADGDAVALFCERAQLDADETIAELCQRLDNLPLALELAAARARLLTPEQMLERLSKRLDLLKAGRDAEARQQTLRAAIEWSYDLLAVEEQELFRRLAVFTGSCDLEAAGEVAEADLDVLQALVDKSLVRRTDQRFSMLETIREFASERLEASGEADDRRRRHADYYLDLAETSGLSTDIEAPQRFDLVLADQSNLRAALVWLARADPTKGLRLVVALEMFWVTQNPSEGEAWFARLLDAADEAPPLLRAHALRAYGGAVTRRGDLDRGRRLYEQGLAAYRTLGDDHGASQLLTRLGEGALLRGEHEEGRALLQESLELYGKTGFRKGEAQSLGALALAERLSGSIDRARELAKKSAAVFEQGNYPWLLAATDYDIAEYALEAGELGEADEYARGALSLYRGLADRHAIVSTLALLAVIAVRRGDVTRAGRIWGAVEAEEARASIGGWKNERDAFRDRVGQLDAEALAEGTRLTLDDAAEYALSSA